MKLKLMCFLYLFGSLAAAMRSDMPESLHEDFYYDMFDLAKNFNDNQFIEYLIATNDLMKKYELSDLEKSFIKKCYLTQPYYLFNIKNRECIISSINENYSIFKRLTKRDQTMIVNTELDNHENTNEDNNISNTIIRPSNEAAIEIEEQVEITVLDGFFKKELKCSFYLPASSTLYNIKEEISVRNNIPLNEIGLISFTGASLKNMDAVPIATACIASD